MPSPKFVLLLLSAVGRGSLEALVRKRTGPQSLALQARIVLVGRVDGLVDAPRPGAPRKITGEPVEVVDARCRGLPSACGRRIPGRI
jgi:hypothetical protein